MKRDKNDPVDLVVAGAGLVGRRHVESMRTAAGCALAAIVDPDPAARDYAAGLGTPHFTSLGDMFDAISPDGVVLATPTPLHIVQALDCVAQRCPVLVEKPLGTSAEEARDLVREAGAQGVPVLVGHHRRHNPLIAKAFEIISSGQIGQIRTVTSTCWLYKPDSYFEAAPWRTRKGAGPISVNLVHDADLIRYLCGDVVCVQAQAAPSTRGFENEEAAAAVLRFASGAVGTLSVADGVVSPWSWELTAQENPAYPATSQSSLLIGGTQGALSVPDLTLWTHPGPPGWWSPISATRLPRPVSDPLVNQLEHFADVIRGDAQPLVSALEGLRSLELVEAIQKSADTGGTVEIGAGDGGKSLCGLG